MNVIFDKIYIFDVVKKEAYSTEFEKGVNIITSSDIDGTDRGKSVLLRSLYHALGADSHFDSKWREKDKVYILSFKVDDKDFSIYRSQKLFKIFNAKGNLIFTTIHRSELADFLGNLFNFSIWLPQKNTNQLVIAPPAYSFLLKIKMNTSVQNLIRLKTLLSSVILNLMLFTHIWAFTIKNILNL